MKAIGVKAAAPGTTTYSTSNPAPSSAIITVERHIPKPQKAGDVVVKVKATTVTRDGLTWPELYEGENPAQLGNDFSGIISAVYEGETEFNIGDEVYGMTSAHRGGAWAEYVLVEKDEFARKPHDLSWEQAACLPMSAMTADQALFVHAGLNRSGSSKTVLVTGAAGGVGMYVVQLARFAGHKVIAATSSLARDRAFLQELGADNIIEYNRDNPNFESGSFDVVINTVGGKVLEVLKLSPSLFKRGSDAVLVTIDSASYDIGNESRDSAFPKWKFFILEPSRESLDRIAVSVKESGLKTFVARTMSLFEEARAAYELADSNTAKVGDRAALGKGKIVLVT
ncbi:putative zinc-binding oxidoreductase, mitochondrial [Pseudocercospora fuligena]|uniref:Putative zinc-binding oxidoreductase, mitochondrial n=1 Tax=Pseudocercospora fuligena TaxID=685502 RepID=A0A8H6RW40_9PEZI|nr:putative zinc-binding oxidoreductase, mitochondrial [Pseudocercospora fuligena]